MKLTFSPASPFARKVRIAAIETGLIDKIEFTAATVAPGQANEEYSKITPLKKLPVLILDNGDVILDSYVIVEYLDELAGGGKIVPASGALRWRVKSDHSLLQGMLDSMLLCRYENMVRPEPLRWKAWSDDHWNRAWSGMARFECSALDRPNRLVVDQLRGRGGSDRGHEGGERRVGRVDRQHRGGAAALALAARAEQGGHGCGG